MNDTAPKNNKQENKPEPTLVPLDVILKYVEPAYQEGDIKYKRESWRKGFYTTTMIDAALRHIISFYYGGEDYDPDSAKLGIKKHHLGAAIFSLLSILHTLETRPELDDRFSAKKRECDLVEIEDLKSLKKKTPEEMKADLENAGFDVSDLDLKYGKPVYPMTIGGKKDISVKYSEPLTPNNQ